MYVRTTLCSLSFSVVVNFTKFISIEHAPLLITTRPPRPPKLRPPLTGYSTYRIHLINRCISFHSGEIASPSETGFIASAHRLTNITLLTLIATLLLLGESPTYILNEDTQLVMRAIGVSHTACKDEVRQHILSHSSWCVFFLNDKPRSLTFLL